MLLSDAGVLAASAPKFIFRITVLASVSSTPCRLQSTVRGVVSLASGFLGVHSIVAHPALVDYLLRSHHLDAAGNTTMCTSVFSIWKNTFMQNQNFYLYHSC